MCLTNYKQPEFIPKPIQFDEVDLHKFEFPDTSSIANKIVNCEEKVIIQVLEALLNRKITSEDYRLVARVYEPNIEDWYHLAYKGEILGIIEMPFFKPTLYESSIQNKWTVTFKPAKKNKS